jgi:phenylacetate-CoA ligase
MYNEKLDYTFIKGFISSSENVLGYQKQFIEDQLSLKFLTFYGLSEKLILAWYCKHCECSHVEPSYGYFELINEDGGVISEIGSVGEMVGTTLDNEEFPLIRYRTDDYAELVGFRCEHENRDVVSIKNIRGRRTGSYIFAGDGSKTTPTALNLHDDLYLHIDGIQYVQERKGELIVLIIKGKTFNNEIETRLQSHYIERLKNTEVTLKFVNKLAKQPNGKFLDLISKLKVTND